MNKLEKKLPRGRRRKVHGGYSFLATGKLPEHRSQLLRYLTNCREGLVKDLGGEMYLSTAQAVLIDRVTTKLGCIRCIEEHIRENSVMVGEELAPSLKAAYLAFNNAVRLDLMALGIEKKPERITSLDEYVEKKYGKKEGG